MIFGLVLIKNLSKILIQAHDFWAVFDSKIYQNSLSQVMIFGLALIKNLSKILIPGHDFWAGFHQKSIKNPYPRS
jgi:hypothetical protein